MKRTLLVALALTLAPAVHAAKKGPPKPALPAPSVTLRVAAEPAGKPWRVEVVNDGATPLRIVADIRVLRLAIDAPPPATPPKKGQKPPKPTECALPASMRSDARTLELPPGARWVDHFDPRLHCLDRVDKLVAGAVVTARYGWAAGKTLTPPFAVTPVSAGEVAAAKEIAAAPITLAADAFAPPAPAGAPLSAVGGAARSFGSGAVAEATMVLRNTDTTAHTVYARPQLIDARVINPLGHVTLCSGTVLKPAPIVDFATRLPPKGAWTGTAPLAALCPPGTFERTGLYLVTPIIHLPPMPKVKDAVAGDIVGTTPQLLRIETATKPFYDVPPTVAP